LLVSSIAQAMDLSFSRIQFTPDLMPSDITGTEVLQEDPQTGRRQFEFHKGPIFANLILADEINRTPPKTQSALLQAMQERQISAGNRTMDLPDPFVVLATQNPIEQEGTYPLPEAQLDRFMFMVKVNYPSQKDELAILKRTTGSENGQVSRVIDGPTILRMQQLIRKVPVGDHAFNFALEIVRATRPAEPGASDFVRHWLSWGAGPRAGQYLILAAKARALLRGRMHVVTEDIEAIAPAVLRHRLVPNFNAEAEGISAEQIIGKILALVPRGSGERLL
jgi:MoxR-like ATPase